MEKVALFDQYKFERHDDHLLNAELQVFNVLGGNCRLKRRRKIKIIAHRIGLAKNIENLKIDWNMDNTGHGGRK